MGQVKGGQNWGQSQLQLPPVPLDQSNLGMTQDMLREQKTAPVDTYNYGAGLTLHSACGRQSVATTLEDLARET